MNHLHIMASTVSTDIGDTWLTVFCNRRDLLQNWSNQFIGFFLTTWHDGRPFQSPLFTTGNTGTDKVKTFGRQFAVTTDGVLEEGVAAINDDVAFIEVRLQGIDGAVGASPSLHHQQDTTWCFEGFNKLLYCVVRNQFLAWVFGNHFFGLFTGAVENGDGITTAFDVQRKVTPHYSHTDNPNLLLGHYKLLSTRIITVTVRIIHITLLVSTLKFVIINNTTDRQRKKTTSIPLIINSFHC